MLTRLSPIAALVVAALVSLAGCSNSNGNGTDGNGPVTPIYNPNGSSGGTGNGGTGNVLSGDAALASCTIAKCQALGSPSTCAAETCNGIDDDCNGIIDDLDVGNDGICDCIMIATLGVPGTWGQGDVFGAWLTARASNGAAALGNQVLTAALLKPYQVIVVENVNALTPSDNTGGIGRAYSRAEITALTDWVNQGGGLMTMTGFSLPAELANVNAILGAFGLNYGATPILQKGPSATTVAVTTWFPHATTAGITAIGVDNGYEAQSAQNVGTVVATQSGLRVGRALDAVGQGRVFQWGDEWITYNSEWTQHPDYQVQRFWLNIIKWLTPAKVCQVVIPPILIN